MKRSMMLLILLTLFLAVGMVEQAQAWPAWWGPPHRFHVVRVSYYHWYPHYRPCYRYRPAYVYYPCCDWYYCDGCCDCCYDGYWYWWEPCYYAYSPCWYVHFWVGWGYYTSYCYYYRPHHHYYAYWYHCYPPPYYYDYYYAWYGPGYHHPWHDYYRDGHGRWRDEYAYRDKPYRTGDTPGKDYRYAYNTEPKDRVPRYYAPKSKESEPAPPNRKSPYELAKIDPGKSARSSKPQDEFERKKEDFSRKNYERVPARRDEEPPKSVDVRKGIDGRKDDGFPGKESEDEDRSDFREKVPVPGDEREGKKEEDDTDKKKYEYVTSSRKETDKKKSDEPSRKKEDYSKKKSSTEDRSSSSKSGSKSNGSSSRFSSPKKDSNTRSNVRRPSSSKRGGKR